MARPNPAPWAEEGSEGSGGGSRCAGREHSGSTGAAGTARTRGGGTSASALAAETGDVSTNVEVLTADRPGSDYMVDVLKSLGFEYIAANPGSSFRALHESLINYGGNKAPELLTCCHEESSVALADGYAKVEGRPMAVMAHSTVACSTRPWLLQRLRGPRSCVYSPRQHHRRGSQAAGSRVVSQRAGRSSHGA